MREAKGASRAWRRLEGGCWTVCAVAALGRLRAGDRVAIVARLDVTCAAGAALILGRGRSELAFGALVRVVDVNPQAVVGWRGGQRLDGAVEEARECDPVARLGEGSGLAPRAICAAVGVEAACGAGAEARMPVSVAQRYWASGALDEAADVVYEAPGRCRQGRNGGAGTCGDVGAWA
jgi:hypothetical protein